MKYNIKVQSKEHYKAIIDRLDDLGYDIPISVSPSHGSGVIGVDTKGKVWWSSKHTPFEGKRATLDDLYKDKLEPRKWYGVEVGSGFGILSNVVTINDYSVAAVYDSDTYNETKKLIRLCGGQGVWKDENGNELTGDLIYEPK